MIRLYSGSLALPIDLGKLRQVLLEEVEDWPHTTEVHFTERNSEDGDHTFIDITMEANE